MTTRSYSMRLGDADATRLTLLGQFYDPNSPAFLEAAGVEPGDRVVELGCGHGGVAERITARVGESGVVYMSEIGVPAERSSRTPNTSPPALESPHHQAEAGVDSVAIEQIVVARLPGATVEILA